MRVGHFTLPVLDDEGAFATRGYAGGDGLEVFGLDPLLEFLELRGVEAFEAVEKDEAEAGREFSDDRHADAHLLHAAHAVPRLAAVFEDGQPLVVFPDGQSAKRELCALEERQPLGADGLDLGGLALVASGVDFGVLRGGLLGEVSAHLGVERLDGTAVGDVFFHLEEEFRGVHADEFKEMLVFLDNRPYGICGIDTHPFKMIPSSYSLFDQFTH